MKLLTTINLSNISASIFNSFSKRYAARAVVLDQDNSIALLYVGSESYYKLPGGGVKENESYSECLTRECLEEIGCQVSVIQELGLIIEVSETNERIQESVCYIAKIVGEKGSPNFTEKEKSRNMSLLWVSYEMAHKLLSESNKTDASTSIIARDLVFLEEYEMTIKSNNLFL